MITRISIRAPAMRVGCHRHPVNIMRKFKDPRNSAAMKLPSMLGPLPGSALASTGLKHDQWRIMKAMTIRFAISQYVPTCIMVGGIAAVGRLQVSVVG
jgi:hypothetical protein